MRKSLFTLCSFFSICFADTSSLFDKENYSIHVDLIDPIYKNETLETKKGGELLKKNKLNLDRYVKSLHLPVKKMSPLVVAILKNNPNFNIKTKADREFLRRCLKVHREIKEKAWEEIILDVERAEKKRFSLERAEKDLKKAEKEFRAAKKELIAAREANRKQKTSAAKERYTKALLDYDAKQDNLNLAKVKRGEIEVYAAEKDLSVAYLELDKSYEAFEALPEEERLDATTMIEAMGAVEIAKKALTRAEDQYAEARLKFADRIDFAFDKAEENTNRAREKFSSAGAKKAHAYANYIKKETRGNRERYTLASLDHDAKQENLKIAEANLGKARMDARFLSY